VRWCSSTFKPPISVVAQLGSTIRADVATQSGIDHIEPQNSVAERSVNAHSIQFQALDGALDGKIVPTSFE
jgi:hypothetical protein